MCEFKGKVMGEARVVCDSRFLREEINLKNLFMELYM